MFMALLMWLMLSSAVRQGVVLPELLELRGWKNGDCIRYIPSTKVKPNEMTSSQQLPREWKSLKARHFDDFF